MAIAGLFLDKTLLMRRECGASAATPGFRLVEVDDIEAIVAHCDAAGRIAAGERARRRRDHGLRFFSLLQDGRIVANSWAVRGGQRFLDEAMLLLQLGADAACLRDMYVRREDRGRGLFLRFVELLEAGPLLGIREFWSCVEAGNTASRAAHERAAFAIAGVVSTVALLDRLMWRRHHMPASLGCREFAASRSLIWLGSRARDFRQAQLA